MPRRLDPEERALWRRVTQDVRPLGEPDAPEHGFDRPPEAVERPASPPQPAVGTSWRRPAEPGNTLDGSWDRRLRHGLAAPDMTIDLHGHTLASAHRALDVGIERAIASDVRLLLVVTGRPPRGDAVTRPARGAIRSAIGDWLGASRHAGCIAAVRNAHPRHGGAGALYLVLRRPRRATVRRIP